MDIRPGERLDMAWVRASLGPGSEVLRVWPLVGGTTGTVDAIDAVDGRGERHTLALKTYRPDPTQPDSAWREARILGLLAGSGLPVARVVAVDREGTHSGWPSLLMTRLKGRILKRPTDLKPWLLTLAGLASQIHELPIADRSLPTYGLWGLEDSLVVPAWWRDAGVWSAAVEVFRGPRPHEPPSFIHRDFHPANILWIGRRLTGVVDWLHGCWGPPSADLAHCRINLWLDNSPAAAEALLDAYRQVRPQSPAYNRYWDIADAMSWRLDPNRHGPRRARRWEAFITAAVRAILGGRGVAGELNRAAETMST